MLNIVVEMLRTQHVKDPLLITVVYTLDIVDIPQKSKSKAKRMVDGLDVIPCTSEVGSDAVLRAMTWVSSSSRVASENRSIMRSVTYDIQCVLMLSRHMPVIQLEEVVCESGPSSVSKYMVRRTFSFPGSARCKSSRHGEISSSASV